MPGKGATAPSQTIGLSHGVRFPDFVKFADCSRRSYPSCGYPRHISINQSSGGATPGRDRSNDLAGRSTALAPPCLLLCLGNSVNRKQTYYHI